MTGETGETGQGRKILVIDDSRSMRMKLSILLKRHGYEPISCEDPISALTDARNSGAELIVLDVEMPGMSGYEVCDRLHEDPATENIPVIFLTARDDYMDRLKGLSVGAKEFLNKDFTDEDLIRTIEKILD